MRIGNIAESPENHKVEIEGEVTVFPKQRNSDTHVPFMTQNSRHEAELWQQQAYVQPNNWIMEH